MRSTFLTAVAALAVAAGAAIAGDVDRPQPQPIEIAKSVWLIPGSFLPKRQPDGNTVVFDAGAGAFVVVDTGRHRWQRQAILDFVASRHGRIVAIVNSHWHLDHVSGNPDLKAAYPGARVYASRAIDEALRGFLARSAAQAKAYLESKDLPPETAEDIRADLATFENGQALKPDHPVDASEAVRFGARTLQLNLVRNAATAGDVWVYDPASRVAASGDLVTLPAPFFDTACPEGWRRALGDIWATPFQTLVPGHGGPMSRAQFSRYRKAFEAVIDCSKSARSKTDCAAQWTTAVSPLLGNDAGAEKRARSMTEYYVQDVLRAHAGKSETCQGA